MEGESSFDGPDEWIAKLAGLSPLASDDLGSIRKALLRWIEDGDETPLPIFLRIPSTPKKARLSLRNHYLREAAKRFEGSLWDRACAMHEECSRFEQSVWPRVRSCEEAPSFFSDRHRLIWHACKWGALPCTPQGFLAILRD